MASKGKRSRHFTENGTSKGRKWDKIKENVKKGNFHIIYSILNK